ncbi:MAG: HEAT repeat domain-containing protein, partial [Thermodesulfovibrionales bacterium]
DWKVQISAIKKLAELSDPRGIEILLRLINDPFLNYDCPALKFHASVALGKYKNDSRVIETLITVVSDNDNPISVREAAINSLGEIGDKRALDILMKMLYSDSFALRLSAIRSVGKIGDPSVIPYFEALLDKETDLKREVHIVLNILRSNGVRK